MYGLFVCFWLPKCRYYFQKDKKICWKILTLCMGIYVFFPLCRFMFPFYTLLNIHIFWMALIYFDKQGKAEMNIVFSFLYLVSWKLEPRNSWKLFQIYEHVLCLNNFLTTEYANIFDSSKYSTHWLFNYYRNKIFSIFQSKLLKNTSYLDSNVWIRLSLSKDLNCARLLWTVNHIVWLNSTELSYSNFNS